MKLVASLIVAEGEQNRYLDICLAALGEFCDEVRVVIDADCDSSVMEAFSWQDHRHCAVLCGPKVRFYQHEGRARQRLLDWTLEAEPTHILAIDADEFISDGQKLRQAVSRDGNVWTLDMTEIWGAMPNGLKVRVDRQWRPRSVPILYRVPDDPSSLKILDRALACGREPVQIRQYRNPTRLDISILHFGWAKESERQQRYDRYVEHDGGEFHASAHLLSILDGREVLKQQPWPSDLAKYKSALLERSN